MSDQPTRPRSDGLLGAAEELFSAVVRFSYGLISLPIELLPSQSRRHMYNALRDLTHAFIVLPRTFTELADVEIERWAREADGHSAPPHRDASVQHLTVTTSAPPPPPDGGIAVDVAALKAEEARKAEEAQAAALKAEEARKAEEAQAAALKAEEARKAEEAQAAALKAEEARRAEEAQAAALKAEEARRAEEAQAAALKAEEARKAEEAQAARAVGASQEQGAAGGTVATLGAAPVAITGVAITYIEYDPPGRDVDGEYVLIVNRSDAPVDLTGCMLADGQAKHTYFFPAVTLAPGAEIKLWTKIGTDDAANLYWGSRSAIWNNDGDTGILTDTSGTVVSSYTYAGK